MREHNIDIKKHDTNKKREAYPVTKRRCFQLVNGNKAIKKLRLSKTFCYKKYITVQKVISLQCPKVALGRKYVPKKCQIFQRHL